MIEHTALAIKNSSLGDQDYQQYLFSIAPMMAYTCPHGRYLMRLLAPNVRLYSEMIVDQAIIHGQLERLLAHDTSEFPLAIQLASNNPERLAKAVQMLHSHTQSTAIAEINLNFGCPSSRVQSGGFGACQIKDPIHASEIVQAVAENASVPISVKTRLGADNVGGIDYMNDFLSQLSTAGCKHFILHARKAWLSGLDPKENRTLPPLDYACVYQLKEAHPDWRIILNGGLNKSSQCQDALSKVDGVMLGRAAFADPWLIAKLQSTLFNDPLLTPDQLIPRLLEYWQDQLMQNARPQELFRSAMNLFQGKVGAKKWRSTLAEQSHKKKPDFLVIAALAHRFCL